jgi:GNAT superfamily N-acetyltransferase
MYCDLRNPLPDIETRVPLRFETVTDYDIFKRRAHPNIGPLTTAMRRFNLESQRFLAALPDRRSWELMAVSGDTLAGICTVFIGKSYAGLFDLAVPEPLRNRGIGRALVRHARAFARDRGAEGMVLIATNLGYRVYEHVGFSEVSRVGFWYTAHP